MAMPDFTTLNLQLGVVRVLEVICTCISFSLAASFFTIGNDPFWTWCMFCWCFCFCGTVLILILEFTSLSGKLPISWDEFTCVFSMLGECMTITATTIYAVYFTCNICGKAIGATVTSAIAIGLYSYEVHLVWHKQTENRPFFSTVPGMLKVLEAFVASVIFACLGYVPYWLFPGLEWCVAVYSICLIYTLLFIIATIGRLMTMLPAQANQILNICNVLAVVMYFTAVIIWPVFSFRHFQRPSNCGARCGWNLLIGISVLTGFNLVIYIVDVVFSLKRVPVQTGS